MSCELAFLCSVLLFVTIENLNRAVWFAKSVRSFEVQNPEVEFFALN